MPRSLPWGPSCLLPTGQDTNSLYLTEKLNELGVEVRFKCIVGDDRENLVAAAKLAMPTLGHHHLLRRPWTH